MQQNQLNFLFDYAIPFFAASALLVASVLLIRTVARWSFERCCSGHARRFGRKGLMVSASSVLFVLSCFYRSMNVADEGAAMCRGAPTSFNAPWAGRAVATVGEIALVVQISSCIFDCAQRLGSKSGPWHAWIGLKNGVWSSRGRFTILPVCIAEILSWSGVLTGVSRFYCCEYIMWCLMAFTWSLGQC